MPLFIKPLQRPPDAADKFFDRLKRIQDRKAVEPQPEDAKIMSAGDLARQCPSACRAGQKT